MRVLKSTFISTGLLVASSFLVHCGGKTSETSISAGGSMGAGAADTGAGGSGAGGSGAGGSGAGGSGALDGGSPDSGTVDSGPPDASPQDAGPDVYPTDAGDPERAALVAAWETIQRDYCQTLAHCCAAEGKSYSQAKCEAAITAEANKQLNQVDSHRAQGHHLDFQRLAATVAAYRDTTQTCADGDPVDKARYWVGEQPLGTQCDYPEYCAQEPGAYQMTCSYTNPAHDQSCTAIYIAKLGESCNATCAILHEACSYAPDKSFTQRTCLYQDNLYCDETVFKCATLAGDGDSCASVPCGLGLICNPTTERCVPLPKAGEPCPGLRCDSNSWCGGPNCVPKGADGDACNYEIECQAGGCGWKGCGSGPEPAWFGYCE